jgi:bacteriocin-like protein
MRELSTTELETVSGGDFPQISGYDGAHAILVVLGTGIAISTAPISAPIIGIALGAAAGLTVAQTLAYRSRA